MSYAEAHKAMIQAEKALAKIRTTRAELEKSAHDAQAKLEAAQNERASALASGKVDSLARLGAIIENGHISLKAAHDDQAAIEQAEHDALGVLVRAEKSAKDALMAEWDTISDQCMAELVAAAGPLLKKLWAAKYAGNYPVSMGEILKSGTIGVRGAIEDAAMQADPPQFPLPEFVESALLSHADRSKFTRHANG
jgi:hypothetical protein